jgi:hypothetical protein
MAVIATSPKWRGLMDIPGKKKGLHFTELRCPAIDLSELHRCPQSQNESTD